MTTEILDGLAQAEHVVTATSSTGKATTAFGGPNNGNGGPPPGQ
ncbi:MAG: hypothetical protein WDM77_05520 [Steroidobacteraceae bacterium]